MYNGFVVGEALGHKECSRRRTCIMDLWSEQGKRREKSLVEVME